jgi:hypothetical protein
MNKSILLMLILAICSQNAYSSCRSARVKRAFDREQGYSHGRKGYIVDHVCALAVGGLDITSNMQYQTPSASRAKDRIENKPIGKAIFCNETNSLPTRTVFNCKKAK